MSNENLVNVEIENPPVELTANGKPIKIIEPTPQRNRYVVIIGNNTIELGQLDLSVAQKLTGHLSKALKEQRERTNPIADALQQIKIMGNLSAQEKELLLKIAMEAAQKTWSTQPSPEDLRNFALTNDGSNCVWEFYVRYWNRKIPKETISQFLEDWEHDSRDAIQKWMHQNLPRPTDE